MTEDSAVRREGGRGVFVAVYAPYLDEPPPAIEAAWRAVEGRPEAVALELRAGQDRFLLLHDPAEGVSRFGELELDGRAAVAVYCNNVLQSLTLAAGRRAACGDALIERDEVENGYLGKASAAQ